MMKKMEKPSIQMMANAGACAAAKNNVWIALGTGAYVGGLPAYLVCNAPALCTLKLGGPAV
ncbi:MAG: hypothetical protein LBI41_00130 [Lactobacillales bacterium]|jgi:hypothetical protein|nr:hypothetical protein [Lactobacillales bacterium]